MPNTQVNAQEDYIFKRLSQFTNDTLLKVTQTECGIKLLFSTGCIVIKALPANGMPVRLL